MGEVDVRTEAEATAAIMEEFRAARQRYVEMSWNFIALIGRVVDEAAYLPAYPSVSRWVSAELKGIATLSTVTRALRALRAVRSMSPALRERATALPFWNVAEAVLGMPKEPEAAVGLVESGASQAKIRHMVREGQPDLHEEAELRTVRMLVPASVHEQWKRAANVVKVHLGAGGVGFPSDGDVLDAVAQTVLLAPELQVPEEYRDDVEGGRARCRRCGSVARLERHHAIPRSHQGHEGPLVWLCHEHHREVTENLDGGWRPLAEDSGVL